MLEPGSDEYYLEYQKKGMTFPRTILQVPKMAWIKEELSVFKKGARVLDAGCGAGMVCKNLLEDYRVFGIDNQKSAVDFATRNSAEIGKTKKIFKPEFVEGDLLNMPYKSNSFDGITFLNVIEHLEDPRPMLKEIARVLAPGGKLMITTENCGARLWVFAEQTWYRLMGGGCKPHRYEVHPQRFTLPMLRACVAEFLQVESLELGVLGMEMFLVATKPGGKQRRG